MTASVLVAVAGVLFVWAALSARVAAADLTGPLVFLVAGFVLGHPRWGVVTVDVDSSTVHCLAEVTLALLLFSDASKVPLSDCPAMISMEPEGTFSLRILMGFWFENSASSSSNPEVR